MPFKNWKCLGYKETMEPYFSLLNLLTASVLYLYFICIAVRFKWFWWSAFNPSPPGVVRNNLEGGIRSCRLWTVGRQSCKHKVKIYCSELLSKKLCSDCSYHQTLLFSTQSAQRISFELSASIRRNEWAVKSVKYKNSQLKNCVFQEVDWSNWNILYAFLSGNRLFNYRFSSAHWGGGHTPSTSQLGVEILQPGGSFAPTLSPTSGMFLIYIFSGNINFININWWLIGHKIITAYSTI